MCTHLRVHTLHKYKEQGNGREGKGSTIIRPCFTKKNKSKYYDIMTLLKRNTESNPLTQMLKKTDQLVMMKAGDYLVMIPRKRENWKEDKENTLWEI